MIRGLRLTAVAAGLLGARVMVRRNARLEMDVDDEADLRALLEHHLSGTETGRWLRASGVEARFLPNMRAGAMSAR